MIPTLDMAINALDGTATLTADRDEITMDAADFTPVDAQPGQRVYRREFVTEDEAFERVIVLNGRAEAMRLRRNARARARRYRLPNEA